MSGYDDDWPDLAENPVPEGYAVRSTSLHMPFQDGSSWERVVFWNEEKRHLLMRRRFVPAEKPAADIVMVPTMRLGRQ